MPLLIANQGTNDLHIPRGKYATNPQTTQGFSMLKDHESSQYDDNEYEIRCTK